jgi:hypothetical protein
LPNHDDHLEDETLTPLQRAQLTAKRVARSTGEAVERLQGSKLDKNPHQAGGEQPKLPESKNNAIRSHHHTTPKRRVAPDTRKLEHVRDTVEHTESGLSPLERAELTAQRVAVSTGKSLERLSKSQTESGLQRSLPLHESTTESGSDTGGSGISRSTNSETRLASSDRVPLADLDHLSSLERVKRTAEMVADSTWVAVQKLSSSLSDSI